MSKSTIENIDVNFRRVESNGQGISFTDALREPFELNGFAWYREEGKLCRLPETVAAAANDGVKCLAWHTSGGAVRFRSDSGTVAIRAELRDPCDMNHMPRNGSAGCDLYLGSGPAIRYWKSAMPAAGALALDAVLADRLPVGEMRDWTLYLPLYGGIRKLEVGLASGARIDRPTPFAVDRPVLFYGSSITQGGCASRTGNAYVNMLSRWVGAPVINLGFSGSGRGEPVIAETIAALRLSAFVFDYDHNAPDPDYLAATHEPFFRIIRERQPDLPIIMLSRCDFYPNDDCRRRREVVRRTWQNAIDNGDRMVYFIDGETLFGDDCPDSCTVDGCHPNDLGFFRIAKTIMPVLQQALTAGGAVVRA